MSDQERKPDEPQQQPREDAPARVGGQIAIWPGDLEKFQEREREERYRHTRRRR